MMRLSCWTGELHNMLSWCCSLSLSLSLALCASEKERENRGNIHKRGLINWNELSRIRGWMNFYLAIWRVLILLVTKSLIINIIIEYKTVTITTLPLSSILGGMELIDEFTACRSSRRQIDVAMQLATSCSCN
jgi:hypothetical protein